MIPDKIYCWNGVLGSFYASPQKQMDTICKELEAKLRGEYEIEEENEDERIRKLLVWQVYRNIEDETNDLAQSVYDGIKGHDPDLEESIEDWKKCLAWLEKQKEQKPKMPPKWLYRLEYKDASCGLWYNGKGKWCFESGIGAIDGCKTKTLLMDYDERYKQDERDWFSSCSRKEDLLHWYSLEDAKELISKGFVFTRYLATEYHEYDQQTVFIKETALYREEIDIFELFEQKPAGKDCEEYNNGYKEGYIDGSMDCGRKPAEWSEEDEQYRCGIIGLIESSKVGVPMGIKGKAADNCINWLKSLRPRFHWKPSEEQMEWLESAVKLSTDKPHIHGIIISLYEQLKRL